MAIKTLTPLRVTIGQFVCICEKVLKKAPYYHIMVNDDEHQVLCSKGTLCSCGAINPMMFDSQKETHDMINLILSTAAEGEFETTVAIIT